MHSWLSGIVVSITEDQSLTKINNILTLTLFNIFFLEDYINFVCIDRKLHSKIYVEKFYHAAEKFFLSFISHVTILSG